MYGGQYISTPVFHFWNLNDKKINILTLIVEQFTYYTRCKFPQNFKVVSICAVNKTLVRMFSGKTIYEKNNLSVQQRWAIIVYLSEVAVATKNSKLVDNILVRGDSTLVFY